MLAPPLTERVATAPGVEVVVTTHGGGHAGLPVLPAARPQPAAARSGDRSSAGCAAVRSRRWTSAGTARPIPPSTADFSVPRARPTSSPCSTTSAGRERSWSATRGGVGRARGRRAPHPDRVAAAVLVDGGLWSPSALGPRDEVRAALTPPRSGSRPTSSGASSVHGDLGPWWSDEVHDGAGTDLPRPMPTGCCARGSGWSGT